MNPSQAPKIAPEMTHFGSTFRESIWKLCLLLSRFSHVWLFATPWMVAHQSPLSMKFSRQEYWSGLPFPPPRIFPTQRSDSVLLCRLHWQAGSLQGTGDSVPQWLSSPVTQMVRKLSAMRWTQVWALGQEDLLEKGMATHSSILAWRIPWTEEPGGLQSWGHKQSDTTAQLTHTVGSIHSQKTTMASLGMTLPQICVDTRTHRFVHLWMQSLNGSMGSDIKKIIKDSDFHSQNWGASQFKVTFYRIICKSHWAAVEIVGPRPASLASLENLLEMQTAGPTRDLLSQRS